MILIDYTNIDYQPSKNLVEALSSFNVEPVPEFTLNTNIPTLVYSISNRLIKKGLGKSKTVNTYQLTVTLSLIDETVNGLSFKTKELRNLLDAQEDNLSSYGMDFHDISVSPSFVTRNDKTYNASIFTILYIVK